VEAAIIDTEKILSPLKTIRRHCLDCCCGQIGEVNLCPSEDCALYPYRFGRGPEVKPQLTPLRSIKGKCLDCSGTAQEATECWNDTCVLYPYRNGSNPNRRGVGGNPAFSSGKPNSRHELETPTLAVV
jgi:hypothetical protein